MEIVLSYVNKLKKQLETLLLRWYNNIVILWKISVKSSADRLCA